MFTRKHFKPSAVALMAVVLAINVSCRGTSAPSESQLAETFVRALNEGNVERMVEVSRAPFFFRDQKWESAPDGSGFVTGSSADKVVNTADEMRSLFLDLTKRVKIANPQAVAEPPSQNELIDNHVKNVASQWSALQIVVFLRGTGDVEHTALVGVEPSVRKVRALYVN